ncbi:GNAT family N-acetyltransferase [Actinoplanes sp. NPDC048796]|uniref:GNAT family N-acetyltransferase n=1 Tax=Actinoplanes sp. NPDC048796 TaxID=3155640 RepID=UPI0034045E3D
MHRVVALVFDGMKMLDLAGPLEVFAEAGGYELEVRSPDGRDVVSSTGVRVPVDGPAHEARDVGTALIVGGDALPVTPIPQPLIDAARLLSERAGRTASVCTGAFLLAAAGLLDGRRATTHWRHARLLGAAYPGIAVEPDALFVADGAVYTSAGVSAGIDLALALVERDNGEQTARTVARELVVFLQRPGGQSQFSPSLALPRPTTPKLRELTDAVAADPAGDHAIPVLAARISVSRRHLSRLFRGELGTSPARYVESVRVDAALRLLTEGHSVTATARRTGIGSPETLRRAVIGRIGVSPRAYQQRFRYGRRMPAELRPARDEDVPTIARIWESGWRDGHRGHVPEELIPVRTGESFRTRAAAMVSRTTVAVADGATVGFVTVDGDEVEQVYVAAASRGSGVAADLLDEAERQVAAGGHATAWLAVVAGNARARRFYERRGWADDGPFTYQARYPGGTIGVPCHRYVKPTPSSAGPTS